MGAGIRQINTMSYLEKARKWLVGTFVVYALLVATNLGEFWPFSIYPMFSQAGNTWTRSVVRDVSDEDTRMISWEPTSFSALEGEPFGVESKGINQNDVANFVSKSAVWTDRRIGALRGLFVESIHDRSLLVYRVSGSLGDDGDIRTAWQPWILMTPDTTLLNPEVAP